MKTITKLLFRGSIIFVFGITTISPVVADVGGGSGRAKSPYISGRLPDDVPTVTRIRHEAARSAAINFTMPSGSMVFWQQVGFAYERKGSMPGKVNYSLTGVEKDRNATETTNIDTIQAITVMEKDDRTLTLRLELFPDISTEDLVKNRPSYTELKSQYAAAKLIRVKTKSDSGIPLALVGKDPGEKDQVRVLIYLHELPIGQKIDLQVGERWWAIKSVTDDAAYPYRVVLKK